MRCRDAPRALFLHVLFLGSVLALSFLLRFLVPNNDGHHLLKSSTLSTQELNEKRLKHAESVINSSLSRKVPKREDLEIRIVTADRKKGYLTQVIGYMLEAYSPTVPHVSACNVEEKMFSELEQFQEKIEVHQLTGRKDTEGPWRSILIKKETRDYWECLSKPTVAKYVMLLEDDSLLIPHFPTLMKSLLSQLDQRPEIDYVKLYHPNNLRKIPSILITITLSITLMCLFNGLLYGRPHPLFIPSTVILYAILRSFSCQLVADVRFYFTRSAYISYPESCCTPAVVFRSTVKNIMAAELDKELSYEGRAKDHILDDSRFIGRQSDMNWVVHIGSFSSIRLKEVLLADKQSIWKANAHAGWLSIFL